MEKSGEAAAPSRCLDCGHPIIHNIHPACTVTAPLNVSVRKEPYMRYTFLLIVQDRSAPKGFSLFYFDSRLYIPELISPEGILE